MNQLLTPEVESSLKNRWEPVYRSQLHYMVTWNTRGRRPLLRDRHSRSLQALLTRTCEERGILPVEFAVGPDHVHLLLGLNPSHSVASVIRELKGRSGLALLAEFPELRVWLRGNLIWDERYVAETVSAAQVARMRERLRAIHSPIEEFAEAS